MANSSSPITHTGDNDYEWTGDSVWLQVGNRVLHIGIGIRSRLVSIETFDVGKEDGDPFDETTVLLPQ